MRPVTASIIEVCPRDGLQNLDNYINIDVKLELIKLLVESGYQKIQATSFVNPKAVPQMKDATEVVRIAKLNFPDVVFTALTPNLQGAKAAYEAGIREISYVISASEAHNLANVRRSIDSSFDELKRIKDEFKDLKVKLDIATAFGCPFDGNVPVENVLAMIEAGKIVNVDQIFLADTIGIANPRQMETVLEAVKSAFPMDNFGLHLHDTYGMGLANIIVALDRGFNVFEASAGGLGGCPFAPGAAGNIASEDLVNMLEKLGIETQIQLDKLLVAGRFIKSNIKSQLTGHLVNISSTC